MDQFDVILIDPPWPEYKKRVEGYPLIKSQEKLENWAFEEIRNLGLDKLASSPSFIFIWVGSQHLEHGRMLLKSWGFKRCEDIVWLKSNKSDVSYRPDHTDKRSLLKKTKEHCLVGIRGDNKKANESYFIHPNIDTDVIMTEEPSIGDFNKPKEIKTIIERFCLGRKRLELFGNNTSIKEGWVVIGKDVSSTNWERQRYQEWFKGANDLSSHRGGRFLGTTPQIENLRPKSPPKSGN